MTFETGVHERDIDPNEARESDFTSAGEVRHDDPIVSAATAVFGMPDCPGCGQRCANCDERMCLKYGPAPIFADGPPVCDQCTTEPS